MMSQAMTTKAANATINKTLKGRFIHTREVSPTDAAKDERALAREDAACC